MTARSSQIRAYRILSCLAILHSAVVLGLKFTNYAWSWLWLGLATSLFLWLLVLAIHPARSSRRFLIPTIIAATFFVPCVPVYGVLIHYSIEHPRHLEWNATPNLRHQWLVADNLEKLLRSNPRIILYSIDRDYTKPPEVKKGYRPVGADEIILPDDMFTDSRKFVRADEVPNQLLAPVGRTINSITEETVRYLYGKRWLILRRETNGSKEAEAEIGTTPAPEPDGWDRELYKGSSVLGYAEITDRAEQRALINALARSARHGWESMMCHNPRHGLYIETGTSTINLTICFECKNVYSLGPNDEMSPFADGGFVITDAPKSLFNAALKRHGIPISQAPSL